MAPLDHWVRHVMNTKVAEVVAAQRPEQLDVLEISGTDWADFGFQSYRTVEYPKFDICRDILPQRFDLIIAEQVFEHIPYPARAAHNVRSMLRPWGMFLLTTPFLIKYHPCPNDYYRWTAQGMAHFLEENNFTDVYTDSWGRKDCLIQNLDGWVDFDPAIHSVEGEAEYPVSVWGFGRRPGRKQQALEFFTRAGDRAQRAALRARAATVRAAAARK